LYADSVTEPRRRFPAKLFTVGVYLGNDEFAQGTGKSKQEAEQAAAQAALDKTGW
jgi:dsRNA-specific ribonuclease